MTRPMLGGKSFEGVCGTLAGIEIMHALRKGQLAISGVLSHRPAEKFYALAA